MDGVLVSTEISNGVHLWVVYVTVDNVTTTQYFATEEDAQAFAAEAMKGGA